ncbi:MAG: diaminopimelate epimerase [Psychroflexus sp.]|nr:diaminopimelate epimerase [Psychroflexus sp.]
MIFYKYHGTANDFIIIDNRQLHFKKDTNLIRQICDRRVGIGADGLILLEDSEQADFKMVYYNSDGHLSSMCGNGGRCIASFAYQHKIADQKTTFEAPDGLHEAFVHSVDYVDLSMGNTQQPDQLDEQTFFVDTGSPHVIRMVDHVQDVDVQNIGSTIRYDPQFESIGGTNVNFVQIDNNEIKMRTYERGVEAETFSCGTGVTAAGITAHFSKKILSDHIKVNTKGGQLSISFSADTIYSNIKLSGPVAFVFKGEFNELT